MANIPWVNVNVQFFDNAGLVLGGGKLYTYAAGGTTPLATYTNQAGSTPNANPVVLDSAGRANVWLSAASYRFDLYTAASVLVWSVDNVVGNALSSIITEPANTFYAGPTTGANATPTFRALVAADLPAAFANTLLSNLGTTSLNAPLLAQTGIDLGAAATAFRFLFLWGTGTFGTTSIKLTGVPTAARVLTLPDATDTLVGKATVDTLTNKTLTTPTIGSFVNAGHTHQSAAQGGLLPPLKYLFSLLTADGAIAPGTPAAYMITKAGVCGLTLGAPTVTTHDGQQIIVSSNTGFAHTITATGLLQTGSAAVNLATFAAFAGASLTLIAYQGKWNVLCSVGVTFS